MIYITGDTHIPIDVGSLLLYLKENELKPNDFLIIAGDTGLMWKNNDYYKTWLNWFNQHSFTTIFVDGNHENFTYLNNLEIEIWNGGKVHKLSKKVIHLMRGQIFNIDGFKFFTFGGGNSLDKLNRMTDVTWWREEEPCVSEYEEGIQNLILHDYKVDYIITHCCSKEMFEKLTKGELTPRYTGINKFFTQIEKSISFKHWYFGHYHYDKAIDDKHTCLFNSIITIK